ncbi:hypothetical protein LXA43DRAFT_1097182 [Ganoderma leucocontextum]|nr:hypothetical protein LXA43DRAFT_1097182 [Ganoderma leucocontextum]
MQEVEHQLQEHYTIDGFRTSDEYLKIGREVFAGKDVHLKCSDGSLLGLIVGSMPPTMHAGLETAILTAMGKMEFQAIHFSYYSRNGEKGDGAPLDAHPMQFQSGCSSRQVNYSQMTPYLSKDAHINNEEYANLCNSFEEVFAWIAEKMRILLPNLYAELKIFAEVLPGSSACPAYPFAGFVLNFNVATLEHRDGKDFKACLVLLSILDLCQDLALGV